MNGECIVSSSGDLRSAWIAPGLLDDGSEPAAAARRNANTAKWCTLGRFHRRNDAPLFGERAATRGRSAMEGGAEHAGCEERYPFEIQLCGSRRSPHCSTRLDERFAAAVVGHPPSPPTRRSSANAPQRAGASQRKVVMSRPVREGDIRSRCQPWRTGSNWGNLTRPGGSRDQ